MSSNSKGGISRLTLESLKTISFVFPKFDFNLFALDHLMTCSSSSASCTSLCCGTSNVVSSAYLLKVLVLPKAFKSATYKKNEFGPITEPCTILILIHSKTDTIPLILVHCDLSVKNEIIQDNILAGK